MANEAKLTFLASIAAFAACLASPSAAAVNVIIAMLCKIVVAVLPSNTVRAAILATTARAVVPGMQEIPRVVVWPYTSPAKPSVLPGIFTPSTA